MQQALNRIRFGCDPELFLSKRLKVQKGSGGVEGEEVDEDTGYKYVRRPVPITGLIGGTKYAPLPLTNKLLGLDGGEYGYNIPPGARVQEDGAALEFNVSPAANTGRMLADVQQIVYGLNKWAQNKGMRLYTSSTAEFTQDYKASHPQAFVVGCDPDFNAYTGQKREPPKMVADSLTRCAGGHVHVGYDKELVPPHIVVQFLDLLLGLPSVFVDKQGVRRNFYGQAGSFRIKDYGVEYRTLSNFWLPDFKYRHDYMQLLFNGIDELMTLFVKNMGRLEALYKTIPWNDVQEAINTENPKMAQQIIGLAIKMDPVMDNAYRFMGYALKGSGIPKVRN